jgi:hypothetical protein
MMTRMMLALGTALVVVGSTFAQAPDAAPVPAAGVLVERPAPAAAAGAGCACEASPGGQFWFTGEAVAAWFSGDRLPALVTTSAPGTPSFNAGIPPLPTTGILFGGNTVNDDYRTGFRLGAGYWFTPERHLGVEAGAMMVESQATLFAAASGGTPILARPFIDATTGHTQAVLIAFPGIASGSVDARASSGNFYEAHLDLAERVLDEGWVRVDSLLGYRYYRYDEGLHVRQTIAPAGGNFAPGTTLTGDDDFATQNEFHGGDFGFRTQFFWQDFTLALLTKLAVGSVGRDVKLFGEQVSSIPGGTPVTTVGGLLVQASNIGNHHGHDWAVLPELGANLAWRATPNLRVTAGYSVLWLDRIVRAADQIDTTVNPGFFPPPTVGPGPGARPAFILVRNEAWVQTVSLGVELSY